MHGPNCIRYDGDWICAYGCTHDSYAKHDSELAELRASRDLHYSDLLNAQAKLTQSRAEFAKSQAELADVWARLAAVEALPERWRGSLDAFNTMQQHARNDCARELAAALEPQASASVGEQLDEEYPDSARGLPAATQPPAGQSSAGGTYKSPIDGQYYCRGCNRISHDCDCYSFGKHTPTPSPESSGGGGLDEFIERWTKPPHSVPGLLDVIDKLQENRGELRTNLASSQANERTLWASLGKARDELKAAEAASDEAERERDEFSNMWTMLKGEWAPLAAELKSLESELDALREIVEQHKGVAEEAQARAVRAEDALGDARRLLGRALGFIAVSSALQPDVGKPHPSDKLECDLRAYLGVRQ